MEQIGEIINCTQNKNSNEIKTIHCINSEALKLGKTKQEYPLKKCNFCGGKLEVTGFYIIGSPFLSRWITQGKYERCNCKESQKYWLNYDEEQRKKKELEEKQEAERKYQEKLSKMMIKSNLGKRFKNRTFETFVISKDNKTTYETCKRYAEKFKELKNEGIGIILNGNYGAGKTHLVAAIAHSLIRQGYQPIFGTLITLLDRIKATYGDIYAKENEEQVINSYINCDLLIIDDLGKEKPSEWTLEKIYSVINTRYENNKPIIITTNYDIDKLKDRLVVNDNYETGEAIVSRLYEVCQGINIQCEDYRLK